MSASLVGFGGLLLFSFGVEEKLSATECGDSLASADLVNAQSPSSRPSLQGGDSSRASAPVPEIFKPDTEWTVVSEGHSSLAGLTVNAKGILFFNDPVTGKTYKLPSVPALGAENYIEESGHAVGQAFGPDGRLYSAAAGERKIVAYTGEDQMEVIAENIRGADLTVANDGCIYVTEPAASTEHAIDSGRIWCIAPGQEPRVLASGIGMCHGLTLSPDQKILFATDSRAGVVYAYPRDGKKFPVQGRIFHSFDSPDNTKDSAPCGIRVSVDGMLFIATAEGIRVCDAAGRLQCVLSSPCGRITHLAFAGERGDRLYIACGGKVYERAVRVRDAGAPKNEPPVSRRCQKHVARGAGSMPVVRPSSRPPVLAR